LLPRRLGGRLRVRLAHLAGRFQLLIGLDGGVDGLHQMGDAEFMVGDHLVAQLVQRHADQRGDADHRDGEDQVEPLSDFEFFKHVVSFRTGVTRAFARGRRQCGVNVSGLAKPNLRANTSRRGWRRRPGWGRRVRHRSH
jgi:hypothetical protein